MSNQILFAETVQLKSGKTMEGIIHEQNEKFLKLDIGVGKPITYYFEDIDSINGNPINHSTEKATFESNAANTLVNAADSKVILKVKAINETLEEFLFFKNDQLIAKQLVDFSDQSGPFTKKEKLIFGKIPDGEVTQYIEGNGGST